MSQDDIFSADRLFEEPPPHRDIFAKTEPFAQLFAEMRRRGEYTYRRPLLSASGPRVKVRDPLGDREMIMFASNNYLGLATDPRVVAASRTAAEEFGYGTGSVALLSGTTALHRELEERIATFYEVDDCCVFPTGYQANVGTIQCLLTRHDAAAADLYSHASIIDGVLLSEGTLKYFNHNDTEALDKLLTRLAKKFHGLLVVTDGVFSMDGDIAPLDRLQQVVRKHGARLLIDEAHALGIIGPTGRGTAEHFGLQGQVDLTIGTLSKAPSGIGGYLAGNSAVVDYIRHFARSHVFSTTFPAPVAAGLIEVFRILTDDPAPRQRLQVNVTYFLTRCREIGLDTGDTTTAIVPVMIPDEEKLRQACGALHQAGFFVNPVTFPAVARGRGRIRVSLMADHSREDLDRLLDALAEQKKLLGF